MLLRKGEVMPKSRVPDLRGHLRYSKVSHIVVEANTMGALLFPVQGQGSPVHWQYSAVPVFSLKVSHCWRKINPGHNQVGKRCLSLR